MLMTVMRGYQTAKENSLNRWNGCSDYSGCQADFQERQRWRETAGTQHGTASAWQGHGMVCVN
jgi:hypothetical protein